MLLGNKPQICICLSNKRRLRKIYSDGVICLRIVHAIIFPVTLYRKGNQSWKKQGKKSIDAFKFGIRETNDSQESKQLHHQNHSEFLLNMQMMRVKLSSSGHVM